MVASVDMVDLVVDTDMDTATDTGPTDTGDKDGGGEFRRFGFHLFSFPGESGDALG